jgi:hypothetical protein
MTATPSSAGARESLAAHVAVRGAEIRAKYGPRIGWAELQRLLADRDCVRYPCELTFDATALEENEMAHPVPKGERPEDGFVLCVHPYFALAPDRVPAIALYQLVLVNYGVFAAPEDAEAFGAAVLGLTVDAYYEQLCALADEIADAGPSAPSHDGGCSCGGNHA